MSGTGTFYAFLGNIYALGTVLIGIVLIADNAILVQRGGIPETETDGKAVGLTVVFMYMEATWLVASLTVLWNGVTRPLLPTLYLIFVAVALIFGAITNLAKGPVRSMPLWYVKAALIFSCIFTALAIFEAAHSFTARAA